MTEYSVHIKITVAPQTVLPGEITDGTILFWHTRLDNGTFTLKAHVEGLNDFNEEIYVQSETYEHTGLHRRIINFNAPETPGYYEVIASVFSVENKHLESFKAPLLVKVA